MSEGSRHFERQSAVQETLEAIAQRLGELQIPYAVVGAMAMFYHGYRRFTEDVDLLVTKEGLKAIHKKLEGLGYVPLFEGGKNLRDAASGVRIEFIITGQFPGDGKPKPVAFPDPELASFERDGIRFLKIESLVELKLASGLTSVDRLKDLTDVQELIKVLRLPDTFAQSLDPYVQEKYRELWLNVHGVQKRFVKVWRDQPSAIAADLLKAMLADGVTLEPHPGSSETHSRLVTTDADVARKYGMHEESEFLDPSDDDALEDVSG